MIKPKKTKLIVEKKKVEKERYSYQCPHCKAFCESNMLDENVLMINCMACGKPVDFREKES